MEMTWPIGLWAVIFPSAIIPEQALGALLAGSFISMIAAQEVSPADQIIFVALTLLTLRAASRSQVALFGDMSV